MDIRVQIQNIDAIQRALAMAPAIVGRYMDIAVKEGIYEIQREAVPRTPVKTGRLRGSYQTSFATLRGELYPTVDYAIYVHEGTRYMRARPYLRDGVTAAQDHVQQRFEQQLELALGEVARQAK